MKSWHAFMGDKLNFRQATTNECLANEPVNNQKYKIIIFFYKQWEITAESCESHRVSSCEWAARFIIRFTATFQEALVHCPPPAHSLSIFRWMQHVVNQNARPIRRGTMTITSFMSADQTCCALVVVVVLDALIVVRRLKSLGHGTEIFVPAFSESTEKSGPAWETRSLYVYGDLIKWCSALTCGWIKARGVTREKLC